MQESPPHLAGEQRAVRQGVIFGVSAYGLWGLIPLYFKAVVEVAPLEVLAHRALWSCVTLALLVGLLARGGELRRTLRNGKIVRMLAVSALLIALNWLIFIYAVESRQIVQASLGYFVTPLLNVLLGVIFLRERLRPWQIFSIVLAAAGMLALTGLVGSFPWISLALALTMGFYGLLRKILPVDSLLGIATETLAMLPFALAYLGYLAATSRLHDDSLSLWGLLMLSGPVTTIPLLLFGGAARRLRLATLGFLQYLTPTLQFLLAVVVFGEPFASAQVLSFACIWTAIAIYTFDSVRAAQWDRLAAVALD